MRDRHREGRSCGRGEKPGRTVSACFLASTLVALAIAASHLPAGASEPIEPASRIVSVAVHPTGATVARSIEVDLPAGPSALRIDKLPLGALDASIRATMEKGAEGAEVAGVLVETVIEKPERSPEDAALETGIKDSRMKLARLGDRAAVLDREIERLREIEVGEPPRKEGEPRTVDPAAWQAVIDRVRAGLEKILAEKASVREERAKLKKDLDDAEESFSRTASLRANSRKRVDLQVLAPKAGTVEIALRYFVPAAGWKPAYRFRVLPDRTGIEIETWARVAETTGEDWAGATLSFGTALPTMEAGPPEMKSWRIEESEVTKARASEPEQKPAVAPDFLRYGLVTGEDDTGAPKTGFFEPPSRFMGNKISLDLRDEDIQEVLRSFAEMAGLNIVVSENVRGRITIKLSNIPWDQALDIVLKTKGLGQEREGNILRIAPYDQLEKEQSRKILERKRRDILDPPVLKIMPVCYALAAEVKPHLERIQSKREDVSIDVDPRTNSLVIKDTEMIVRIMSDLVRSLDVRLYPGQPSFYGACEARPRLRPEDLTKSTEEVLARLEEPAPEGTVPDVLEEAADPTSEETARSFENAGPAGGFAANFDHVFTARESLPVLSDGHPRFVLLDRMTVPARLLHEAVPSLRPEAFLVASFDSRREAPFLDAPADVFLGGDYLGRTRVRSAAPGETIRVSLGLDDGIVIAREDRLERKDVGVVEDAVEEHHQVSIRIQNRTGSEASLEIRERIPFTQEKNVGIDLEEVDPEPLPEDQARDRRWGVLTWRLELPKDSKKQVRYEWTARHPRNVSLSLEDRPDLVEKR